MSVNLQLLGLQKSYRSLNALKSVSLNFEGNKIVVLLGVNGAGKTTLMRIIAGLENPDSGQILINNQTVDSKALRQVSTLVFQKTAMFTASVYDNLAYGLRIRKIQEEEISEKIGKHCR